VEGGGEGGLAPPALEEMHVNISIAAVFEGVELVKCED